MPEKDKISESINWERAQKELGIQRQDDGSYKIGNVIISVEDEGILVKRPMKKNGTEGQVVAVSCEEFVYNSDGAHYILSNKDNKLEIVRSQLFIKEN